MDSARLTQQQSRGKTNILDVTCRVAVVVPSFNASKTITAVLSDIPRPPVDDIIVVDDASDDDTQNIASSLADLVIRHTTRTGFGGSQKTAYRAALDRGADIIIMVHGDYQYDPQMAAAAAFHIAHGDCDVILGNRIRNRSECLRSGMPKVKYFANRSLTIIENMLSGQNFGEWHTGFRAYSRKVLETIPFECNDDGFAFDSALLLQCVHNQFTIGDIPIAVRYFEEASSISISSSIDYTFRTFLLFAKWYAHRCKITQSPIFTMTSKPTAND